MIRIMKRPKNLHKRATKIRKRSKITQRSYPTPLSCRHVPSVHSTTNGKLVVICNPRVYSELAFINIAPTVWCTRCGWVKVTDKEYEYYRGFDGTQELNRTTART